ncbi:unnamed protein product [Ectocarpus sp. 4 AP-2014]
MSAPELGRTPSQAELVSSNNCSDARWTTQSLWSSRPVQVRPASTSPPHISLFDSRRAGNNQAPMTLSRPCVLSLSLEKHVTPGASRKTQGDWCQGRPTNQFPRTLPKHNAGGLTLHAPDLPAYPPPHYFPTGATPATHLSGEPIPLH